jgi:putative membrane protein
MTKTQRVKLAAWLLWLLGLGTAIVLIAHQGLGDVAAATAVAGWGVVWVAAIQLLPMMADTLAWRQLLRHPAETSFRWLFWARWIGESVNNLLPAARLGGEFLRAWLAYRKLGLPGPVAGAGVVVDLTVTVATQILFTLIGLALLLGHGADDGLIQGAIVGAAALVAMLVGFVAAQGAGIFVVFGRVVRALMPRGDWSRLVPDAESLEIEIKRTYGRRVALAGCAVWHLCGWIAGTLEVWVGLWLLGHPVSLLDALMIESLIQAVRGAAFFMPGALGVQEGGLILLGAVIGLAPEVALALSLVKRIRELLVGLPGLLAWQMDQLHRHFPRAEGTTER